MKKFCLGLAAVCFCGFAYSADVILGQLGSDSRVAATGQEYAWKDGDDGAWQAGIPLPDPRFEIQSDTNVVLDFLTGLMWSRSFDLADGQQNWTNGLITCSNLNVTAYGGYTDWRMPNVREWVSLMDWSDAFIPTLSNIEGTGVWSNNYPFVCPTADSQYYLSTTTPTDSSGAYRGAMRKDWTFYSINRATLEYILAVRGP